MDGWHGARVPDPDPERDEERRARYWEWSDAATFDVDDAPVLARLGGGRSWVRLETGLQADYEAKAMRHSVGHSFEHYGSFGPIFSLRDEGNVPSVTILVSDNVVVHARRAENAPLTSSDLREVHALAAAQGWEVMDPESL